MSDSQNSVTLMLSKLKGGDEVAAQLVWDRFFDRVTALARKKLGAISKRIGDEEDVALSAINALYQGAADGRFHTLKNRDDLWQILCMITSRKAASAWRKQKSRKEVGESVLSGDQPNDDAFGIEHIATAKPDQVYVDSLTNTSNELLEGLNERLREVAILKLQGHKNQEIADKIGRSIKSVERYIATIREQWQEYR
ncbi:MAG: ECF-type sigma factor [Planctomycetota bacterium]